MTADRLELAVRELVAAIRADVRPPPEPSLFLTLDEAARQLRIGRTSLYGMLDRGELPSVKVGRRRLVPRAAIDALEASGPAEAGPDRIAAADRRHSEPETGRG